MPQVPYSPVPQVQQQVNPVAGVHIDAPAAAFGGASAAGLGHLGQATTGVGDEMFKRAIALQQLDNDTQAKQADSDYMISAGDIHAKFGALQGQDAVKAYPKYSADLKAERERIRESLPNDMAKKMYDSQSLSTMGRSIFNGAGHAALAQKQYVIGTAEAQDELYAKAVSDDPKNEHLFTQTIEQIKQNRKQIAAAKGIKPGDPQEQLMIAQGVSKGWADRIIGLSGTSPFEAKEMLDKNSTNMLEPDRRKVENIVTNTGRAVGATNIANEVYAGGQGNDQKLEKPLRDLEAEAEAKAKKVNPNDPILAQHAVVAVRNKYNQEKYATTRERANNEQIVLEAMQSGVKNDQELLLNPKVAEAYNALPANSSLKRKPLNYQVQQYNTQHDMEEQQQNWTRLSGLAVNDQEAYLNADIAGMKLSETNRRQAMLLRAKIVKQEGGDLRVQHAMVDIRGARGAELNALKIYKRDPNNPDDYDKFSGALQGALDTYLQDNKKPADYDTIVNTIAPRLMKTFTEPGHYFGTNETPSFKPSDYTKEYTDFDVAYKKNFPAATDEQTYGAYQRFQYQRLYGRKDSK